MPRAHPIAPRATPAFLLLAVALAGCSGAEPPVAAPATTGFTIATYNVNFGLAGDPQTLDAIGTIGADIVALQEVTEPWERAIRDRYQRDYPYLAFHHYQPYPAGGVALLSRYPIRERALIDGIKSWFPAWRVDVDVPGRRLQLLVVHLRPVVSDDGSMVKGLFQIGGIHDQEIRHFAARLEPQRPTIVLGDFNESKDARAIAFLAERGFADALPRFAPNATTWRWPTKLGEMTAMLDHILVGPDLEIEQAEGLELGRSDHWPVRVRIGR